ncbi:hypothetical protein ACFL3T_02385 [Patescibacteria group bacterium]
MKQKVVKLELSKLVAIVIAVIVLAFAAGFFVQSSYFQGMVNKGGVEKVMETQKKQVLKESVEKIKKVVSRADVDAKSLDEAVMLFDTELTKAGTTADVSRRITDNVKLLHSKGKTKELSKSLDEAVKSMTLVSPELAIVKLDAELATEAAKSL